MLYSFEIHASSSGPRLSSTSVPSRSALSAITLKWELNESICEREWYSGIHRPVSDWADASESLELLGSEAFRENFPLTVVSCVLNRFSQVSATTVIVRP